MPRVRNYVFTLNNYDANDIKTLLDSVGEAPTTVVYLAMQAEIGENGTPHLQGYMELRRAMTLTALKRNLGLPTIHLEARRGTQAQAIAYVKKDNTRAPGGGRWEIGTRKRFQGNGAIALIIEGKSMKEVAEEFPAEYVRSNRGLLALKLIRGVERNWVMDIHIYYGQTGTGKSFKAYEENPDAYTVAWPTKKGVWWWPNYDAENVVILDEFRHQIPFSAMLRIMDRYPYKIQTKGGYFHFNSHILIFTTNIDPYNWYPGVEDRSPFLRRLKDFCTIHEFGPMGEDEDGEPVPDIHIRDMDTLLVI